jgi:hypothetical protein
VNQSKREREDEKVEKRGRRWKRGVIIDRRRLPLKEKPVVL